MKKTKVATFIVDQDTKLYLKLFEICILLSSKLNNLDRKCDFYSYAGARSSHCHCSIIP